MADLVYKCNENLGHRRVFKFCIRFPQVQCNSFWVQCYNVNTFFFRPFELVATALNAVNALAVNKSRNICLSRIRRRYFKSSTQSSWTFLNEFFFSITQNHDRKLRQNICRNALDRSNKVREVNTKRGSQKRKDMNHSKVLSRATNNRKY